jgi:MFS superfamily sulfate permease-like transporter
VDDVDFTGGKTLLELAAQLAQRSVVLAVAEANEQVLRELDEFGVVAAIGADHVYPTVDDALVAFRDS